MMQWKHARVICSALAFKSRIGTSLLVARLTEAYFTILMNSTMYVLSFVLLHFVFRVQDCKVQ